MTHSVSESIYSGSVVVPMADVQHMELHPKNSVPGMYIITKHTHWDCDHDVWANAIWMNEPEATAFRSAWCRYRAELEADTLADISPASGLMKLHDETISMLITEPRP